MLFSDNDERTNDRVLYKTKPNMILGCKKAIFGVVLLVIIFMVSPLMIKFIGKMQVYLISQVKLPLTRYVAIAVFIAILVAVVYIIWQIIKWYSTEYILTDTRIIIKSGILSTKKSYMPYTAIQDINSSQSILAKILGVGTVSVFSAYDNNLMKLDNISNPSKVEEIIFSNMMGYRNFQEPPRNFIDRSGGMNYSNRGSNNEYYDEYEPITPIGHERNSSARREYEYYPENFGSQQPQRTSQYEYEPYEDEFDYEMERAMSNSNARIKYEGAPNTFSDDATYNERRDDYSHGSDEYYQNDEYETDYDEVNENFSQDEPEQVDSSENVIRRHFDKFKK